MTLVFEWRWEMNLAIATIPKRIHLNCFCWYYLYHQLCVFVLRPLLFPQRGRRTQALSSGCKTDRADFTDWMLYLTSNFIEQTSPNKPRDYPENFGIYSQLDRKSKTCLFTFLNVYVSWIEQGKILILQLLLPKFRYFPMKMNFEFPNQLGFKKQMKKWCHLSGFMSPSWVMVLILSKIVAFLQFFADVS